MSLDRFVINGEVEGYMSESLAKHHGLVQVDLNEFIHKFVKVVIKENLSLKKKNEQLENKRQEVIDYLEKEIEENRKCMNKTNIKLDKLHYMKRIEYAKEILEIMRGEE